jgi:hypothetical protein
VKTKSGNKPARQKERADSAAVGSEGVLYRAADLESGGFDSASVPKIKIGANSTMNVINKKQQRRSRLCRISFLLGALFSAFLMMTEKAFSEVPRGVFCLLPSGQGNGRDPLVYSDPDVDGVSVRQDWSDLEPSEGLYDWRFLDNVTARAGAAG